MTKRCVRRSTARTIPIIENVNVILKSNYVPVLNTQYLRNLTAGARKFRADFRLNNAYNIMLQMS